MRKEEEEEVAVKRNGFSWNRSLEEEHTVNSIL